MIVKQIAVLAVATLSAIGAGGGVIALAHAQSHALSPSPMSSTPPVRSALVTRAADGHFWADARVEGPNGRSAIIHCLIDTGASAVALTPTDAARIGIKPMPVEFTRPIFTAEGQAKAAPVTLSNVDVLGAEVEHVKALVMRRGAQSSLLGMSYLGRLSRIEATPTQMVLRR